MLPGRYGGSGPLAAAASGTLAGDADGPAADNRVRRLTPLLGPASALIGALVPGVADKPIVLTPSGQVQAQDAAPVVEAFDYVWANRADMVADFPPVGGVISLPSCSIATTGVIQLQAGERVVQLPSTRVFICGMGEGKALSIPHNDAGPAGYTVPADARLIATGLALLGSGATVATDWTLLDAVGELQLTNCFVSTNGGRALRTAARCVVTATNLITLDAQPAVVCAWVSASAGQMFADCSIDSSGVGVSQTTAAEVVYTGCDITSVGHCIEATAGRLYLSGCFLQASGAAGNGINANGATYVVAEGSRIAGGAGTGYAVVFPGAPATLCNLMGCQLFGGGGGFYNDGTMNVLQVIGAYVSVGGGTAFNFATAPVRSTLMGVQMYAATAVVGDSAAAPNCWRGLILTATPQTETPITP